MKIINLKLPLLSRLKMPIPIVTVDETEICMAIDKYLPGVHHLQCWKHFSNSIKLCLQRHGATSGEILVYVSHLWQLFHEETEDSYNEMLTKLHRDWTLEQGFLRSLHAECTSTGKLIVGLY